jgi:hypothetical protein
MVLRATDSKAFNTAQESVKPTKFEPEQVPTQMNDEQTKPGLALKDTGEYEIRNAKVNNLRTEDGIYDMKEGSRANPPLIFTPPHGHLGIT